MDTRIGGAGSTFGDYWQDMREVAGTSPGGAGAAIDSVEAEVTDASYVASDAYAAYEARDAGTVRRHTPKMSEEVPPAEVFERRPTMQSLEALPTADRKDALDELYRSDPRGFAELSRQAAAGEGSEGTATQVLEALRRNATAYGGAGDATSAVHNEILGLRGEGADRVKEALLAATDENQVAWRRNAPYQQDPTLDRRARELASSRKDPVWGQVVSLGRQHPEELAVHLKELAHTNRKEYTRAVAVAVDEIALHQGRANRQFIAVVTAQTGTGATDVKIDVARRLTAQLGTLHRQHPIYVERDEEANRDATTDVSRQLVALLSQPEVAASMLSSEPGRREVFQSALGLLMKQRPGAATALVESLARTYATEAAAASKRGDDKAMRTAAMNLGLLLGETEQAMKAADLPNDTARELVKRLVGLLPGWLYAGDILDGALAGSDAASSKRRESLLGGLLDAVDAAYDARHDPEGTIRDLSVDEPARKTYDSEKQDFRQAVYGAYDRGVNTDDRA